MADARGAAPTWNDVMALARKLVREGRPTSEDAPRLAQMILDFDLSVHGLKLDGPHRVDDPSPR